MIVGRVNARLEAIIDVPVRDSAGQVHLIAAVIDTGFTGRLTLPPATIARLGLPYFMRGSALLANGNLDYFDIHDAVVEWDGIPRAINVESADTDPLVGTGLLSGYDLRIPVRVGETVVIDVLP